eukprot:COSAG06_NODE_34026_length_480_cov_11.960630_1_plen_22_part_10
MRLDHRRPLEDPRLADACQSDK